MGLLLLLRHAKSSWDDPSLDDRDRPLAGRGRRAAERVGDHLRRNEMAPELVLCSSARRARETLDGLALGDVEVSIEDGLYGAGEDLLLARVRRVPDHVGRVLVVGHNPGIQDLATRLAGKDAAGLREKFPTGALAAFDVDGPWAAIAPGRARLVSFVVPRRLR